MIDTVELKKRMGKPMENSKRRRVVIDTKWRKSVEGTKVIIWWPIQKLEK